uniref:hypothetical protein n=1 Tax=Flavobacterium sp. TaxID=239 RepID=UPI00404B0174
MKKITFLVAGLLFLGINSISASDRKVLADDNERRYNVDYRYANPIVFLERGIEFYVFPDGGFDFNTVSTNRYNTNSGRRYGTINTTYGAPGVQRNISYNSRNAGVIIEHDNMGRVRRVGNVFINYDFNGRVKRVGNVYMRYNSFALTQIGGLKLIYNRRGSIVNILGSVNNYSSHYQYDPNNSNGNSHYNNNVNDYGEDTNDYYYYKNDGSKAKMSDEDIVAIRKS